jgi:thioredoxin 1
MKKILMFTMASCPYCQNAHRWMNELLKEHPEYKEIEIEIIDEVEQPELADTYDYYYVPTYYVDGTKVHEGVPTKQIIRDVYTEAYGK